MEYEFEAFAKIPRLSRPIIVTEKIDGTNAQIHIEQDGTFLVGSRKQWLSKEKDNFGFHRWAQENKDELITLGPGRHFGEWWGSGIQRGYGLPKGEKRFSLFNTTRWGEECPACCRVVPVLRTYDIFHTGLIDTALEDLARYGSRAAPGFMDPEGVVVFHTQGNFMFKKTIKGDDAGKNHGG